MNDCKVQWMKYWVQSWTLHYNSLLTKIIWQYPWVGFFVVVLLLEEGGRSFPFRKGSRHFTKLFLLVMTSLCAERIICVICHAFISDYINDTNEWSQLSQFYWNSLFSLPPTLFKSLQWPWQLIDWDNMYFCIKCTNSFSTYNVLNK